VLQEPLPDPQPDDPEPDGSCPAAQSGVPEPEHDLQGPQQGLFVCLPAEELSLAGFAQNGQADTMAPGGLLATVLHTVIGEDGCGLPGLSDDQLIGVLSGAKRMESYTAWVQLAALRELARRRPAVEPGDTGRAGFSDFAGDELMAQFHLTREAATGQILYACAVADRLPRTFAALAAGRIHPFAVKIIEDETMFLSSDDVAKADEALADLAQSNSFARLRYAAHRLVLKLDPDYAKRRKDEARKYAHVSRFREDTGNAAISGREMPPDEVLASWQHVEQRALELRAAGVPGTLQELRVRAFLDLLQETDSRDQPADSPAAGGADPDQPPRASGASGDDPADGDGPGGGDPADGDGPGGGDDPADGDGPGGPGENGGPGSAGYPGGTGGRARPDPEPSVAALVTVTVPLETLQGLSEAPGEVGGFGLLDADDARDLAAAAARHPRTRWCVTALNPDGTAAAHGCARGRHPPPGIRLQDYLPSLKAPLIPVARGPCDHAHAELGYHPSRALQHLIRARSATCTAPGCSRPAARCDLDHTIAWDKGGLSCECNLAPLCRHHHRMKQREGWQLAQKEPGVLIWQTPSGRTYTTTPTIHPA
jgi:hypothetical protein